MRSRTSGPGVRADAQENRESLLNAGAELLSTRGGDVSMDEIAQRAGVGRATLYRHFPSRQSLADAIVERVLDQLEEVDARLPDDPGSFQRLFDAGIDLQMRNLAIFDLLPGSPEAVRSIRRRLDRLFRPRLESAQAGGRVRADLKVVDVRLASVMLAGVLSKPTTTAEKRRARDLVADLLGTPGRL